MADFTITVSNTLNFFETASKWGFMLWGVDNWGSSTQDLTTSVEKSFSHTITATQDIAKDIVLPTVIQETIALTSDATTVSLRSGVWDYVYTLPTINNDLAAHTSYSSSTVGAISWTCSPAGSTVWS